MINAGVQKLREKSDATQVFRFQAESLSRQGVKVDATPAIIKSTE
jgi:hypothetical protein